MVITDEERIRLLESFASICADYAYNANIIAQTSIQLLIKKNIVTYDEAAKMKKSCREKF